MVFHFLECGVRILGFFDAHNLYLIELVQTVEAAYVFSVAACFAAETCRVCAVLDRKLVGRDDFVAVKVGDGYFGGRNQIELVELAYVHLGFLIGELARAVCRGFVHYVRRFDFNIACFRGFVEEELYEGALEFCALAYIDGESGACDFHAEVEVD